MTSPCSLTLAANLLTKHTAYSELVWVCKNVRRESDCVPMALSSTGHITIKHSLNRAQKMSHCNKDKKFLNLQQQKHCESCQNGTKRTIVPISNTVNIYIDWEKKAYECKTTSGCHQPKRVTREFVSLQRPKAVQKEKILRKLRKDSSTFQNIYLLHETKPTELQGCSAWVVGWDDCILQGQAHNHWNEAFKTPVLKTEPPCYSLSFTIAGNQCDRRMKCQRGQVCSIFFIPQLVGSFSTIPLQNFLSTLDREAEYL